MITIPHFENKVEGELGISAISVRLGRCEICIFNALKECMKENPKWFTPKTKKVACLHQDKVLAYVQAKVEEKPSITLEKAIYYNDIYESECDESEYEYIHYCKKHFLQAVNDLITMEAL